MPVWLRQIVFTSALRRRRGFSLNHATTCLRKRRSKQLLLLGLPTSSISQLVPQSSKHFLVTYLSSRTDQELPSIYFDEYCKSSLHLAITSILFLYIDLYSPQHHPDLILQPLPHFLGTVFPITDLPSVDGSRPFSTQYSPALRSPLLVDESA